MSDYQPLHITRTFEAPRQKVWDAWTQPELFKQWYMPTPFSVPSCEFDVRPGGKLHVDTQGPDGVIMPVEGEFTVVEEPSKLAMTNRLVDADGKELFQVLHSIVLTETEGGTTLEITSEVLSAGPDADPFLSGMKPGLEQALDQLAGVVATEK
jgi:uncharacterized protein YndB with AHSA1/START domain